MRLTIFWRMILAQLSFVVLILAVSLYAFSQLHRLTGLSADILTNDAACIEEEKKLFKIFLAQMRSAEKYILLKDKAFYEQFLEGETDFKNTLEKIAVLVDTPEEQELLSQVRVLQERYAQSMTTARSRKGEWNSKEKAEISDNISAILNELVRMGEETIATKTAATRDKAALAASVMGWLTVGGICVAILLVYVHARRVSRPLKTLTQELRYVGRGEFGRSLDLRAPREVADLAQSFNWMAARLAELDEMKADFVAHMSHELRTPLTAVQEGTALLLEEIPGPLTDSQREIVEVVRSHSQRLYHSLASVLDLSKMEAHMMEYTLEPSDLVLLMNNSVETVRLIAQKKQLQVEVHASPLLPLLLLDEKRIQQVLDNLLSNAVKFTPSGGTVAVSTRLRGEDGSGAQWVEVRVTDSGIGVPPEDVERIFRKFYQSPLSKEQSWRGTGLGLAIARYVVEAHGGKIWVESQVGEGATFIFTLPVGKMEAHERTASQLIPQMAGSNAA